MASPDADPEYVVEYKFDTFEGDLVIKIVINRELHYILGPFDTIGERQLALDDLLGMVRSLGGKDFPGAIQ